MGAVLFIVIDVVVVVVVAVLVFEAGVSVEVFAAPLMSIHCTGGGNMVILVPSVVA